MPALPRPTPAAHAVLFAVCCVALCTSTAAQEAERDIRVSVGGLIQAEATTGWTQRLEEDRDRMGLGLRRTRVRVTADIGPRAGAFVHLQADGGTFGILDAYASYKVTSRLRLRLGRMASAQPRAFILTPVTMMDATERAAIALRWNGGTLGNAGRDFGLDAWYQADRGEFAVFVHNGDGSFDQLRGNYQQNIVGDVTGGLDKGLGEMAVSVYGAYRPAGGFEVGGYAGVNGSGNPATTVNGVGRDYVSYSGHLYWGAVPGSQPVRLKGDVIGIRYEEVDGVEAQQSLGASILGAVAVHRAVELFARAETFDDVVDGDGGRSTYLAGGVSFSSSRLRGRSFAQERLTLGYSARVPENDDDPLHQLLTLQAQFVF